MKNGQFASGIDFNGGTPFRGAEEGGGWHSYEATAAQRPLLFVFGPII